MGWGIPNKVVQRVKVAPELVMELSADWSEPVQVKLVGRDADGDLEMVFQRPERPTCPACGDYLSAGGCQSPDCPES